MKKKDRSRIPSDSSTFDRSFSFKSATMSHSNKRSKHEDVSSPEVGISDDPQLEEGKNEANLSKASAWQVKVITPLFFFGGGVVFECLLLDVFFDVFDICFFWFCLVFFWFVWFVWCFC